MRACTRVDVDSIRVKRIFSLEQFDEVRQKLFQTAQCQAKFERVVRGNCTNFLLFAWGGCGLAPPDEKKCSRKALEQKSGWSFLTP